MRYLWFKEAAISAINGVVWGGVMGLVMAAAIVINLVVAAEIAVPAAMHRLGRDPAFGSSVLLTFTTDSTGLFVFLGLATLTCATDAGAGAPWSRAHSHARA